MQTTFFRRKFLLSSTSDSNISKCKKDIDFQFAALNKKVFGLQILYELYLNQTKSSQQKSRKKEEGDTRDDWMLGPLHFEIVKVLCFTCNTTQTLSHGVTNYMISCYNKLGCESRQLAPQHVNLNDQSNGTEKKLPWNFKRIIH